MPVKIVEEKGRTEFPFPPIEPMEPPSSSETSASRSRSSRSRSQHTSSSSPPRDYDRRNHGGGGSSSNKLLSRLISRDERDTKQLRTVLLLTSDRLESETRRADEAERRIIETLHRLRGAHEATMLAQADAARANEEVRLYKLRLEDAQREISRAQEIVDAIMQEKAEAEAEAARARTTARKFREERLVARARDEGRKLGFQEGLARGKNMAWQEGREEERVYERERRWPPPGRVIFNNQPLNEEEEEEEEEEEQDDRNESPPVPIIHIRSPRAEPIQGPWRPQSSNSRASVRTPPHVSDTAPHAATLPVPTITTPLRLASPSHAPSPAPIPIPNPSAKRSNQDDDEQIHPIPIRQPVPSPSHPPVSIPPDGWIPYGNSSDDIMLPPPHELSRPVSPSSPTPSLPDSRAPPAPIPINNPAMPTRDTREFAYPSQYLPSQASASATFSPQSKTSTRISDYDLVSRPSESRASSSHRGGAFERFMHAPKALQTVVERATTPSKRRREDRAPMSPRGPRPRDDLTESIPSSTPPGEAVDRDHGGRSPLDRIFRKRYRNRTSGGVPDITVESPSSTNSSHRTHHTISQPHLLSPESKHRPLSIPEEIHVLIQGKPNSVGQENNPEARTLPPLPEPHTSQMVALPVEELPQGFVPSSHSRSSTPFRSRTASPRGNYVEAPIPAGVVYPDPPGKRGTPNVSGAQLHSAETTYSPPGRQRAGSADQLSPLDLFSPLP